MPTDIGREDVQRLVAQGAPLVEVLPLRKIEPGARATLDPERSVIVHCWDSA